MRRRSTKGSASVRTSTGRYHSGANCGLADDAYSAVLVRQRLRATSYGFMNGAAQTGRLATEAALHRLAA
jgi:hypothetical protein